MEERFYHFIKKSSFLEKQAQGEITSGAIVFIDETKEIFENGHYFKCMPLDSDGNTDVYNKEEVNALIDEKIGVLSGIINNIINE